MNIEVELPDGSVAEFPQGTPPEIMQAEIERVLGGNPANPSRNPDPTGQGPDLRVPNRLIQGQRGGGNADMPPPRSMSAFPMQQSPDQAPQIEDPTTRRETYQPPTMGASEMNTPAVRNATAQSAPSSYPMPTANERSGPVSPSGSSVRSQQRPQSAPVDGASPQSGLPAGSAPRREANPQPVPDEQVDQAISKYQELTERLLDPNLDEEMRRALETQRSAVRRSLEVSESTSDWAKTRIAQAGNVLGAATDAVGQGAARAFSIFSPELGAAVDRRSQGGGAQNDPQLTGPTNSMERAAQDSALEAARLRAEQGITSARGSMGDNITQGNQDAAAAQADQARTAQTGDNQAQRPMSSPGGSPAPTAMQALNASEGLQFPQSLSTREARSDRADLNAGAPNSFPARKMPTRAADTAVKTGMDRLHEMKDQYIELALRNGDWKGAAEFSAFMNQDRTQRGMTQMNRAFAAATYGDNDAFVPALAEMVKQFDPDGPWQVNKKDTKLIEEDGQAVGAMLSLTNKDTGEVVNQDYMGMQSVLAGISQWGSPMGHFEANQQRVEAAVTQKLERASNFQSTYDEVMKAMFPADSWVDFEKNYIGEEEQQRRNQAVMQRIQQVRPDLVPQGAASGVGAGGFTGGSNGQPVPTLGG